MNPTLSGVGAHMKKGLVDAAALPATYWQVWNCVRFVDGTGLALS